MHSRLLAGTSSSQASDTSGQVDSEDDSSPCIDLEDFDEDSDDENGVDEDDCDEHDPEDDFDEDDMDDDEYEVEDVVGIRMSPADPAVYEFSVKWVGYPSEANTWEPASNLSNAQELVKRFLDRLTAASHGC